MKTLPLLLGAALYVWQATNYAFAGEHGLAVAFLAYATANVAFAATTS